MDPSLIPPSVRMAFYGPFVCTNPCFPHIQAECSVDGENGREVRYLNNRIFGPKRTLGLYIRKGHPGILHVPQGAFSFLFGSHGVLLTGESLGIQNGFGLLLALNPGSEYVYDGEVNHVELIESMRLLASFQFRICLAPVAA